MKRIFAVIILLCLSISACQESRQELYTIGILQMNDAPTLNSVREGFIRALDDNGFKDGKNVRLWIRSGKGEIPEVQRIAQDFISRSVDMLVALSTPSLQAALHATRETPVIFSSVANPFLAGAGDSVVDHRDNVTGVSSEGPIKQSLSFIKNILPQARRIGTLWTPSELNSKFYLDLAREGAAELGLEIISVPVYHSSEVMLAAQVLINEKIDAIYQVSDNTINDSFAVLGQVATENSVPLFGGFLQSTQLGASAAMGWDFFEMGYKAGEIALRVKNGESPGNIPFQYMDKVLLHINMDQAKLQGITIPEEILKSADRILVSHSDSSQDLTAN